MKKRKTAISPHHYQNQNLQYVSIVASSPPTIQWQSHKRLSETIWQQELTNSLEILEWYGFDSDLGIFAIRQLEDLMRRAV